MVGVIHTVLFRMALVVTLLFVVGATGLAVTRSRLEPVLSGSMTPAIPRHSLILAVPVHTDDLRVGDVVVFQPPGSQASVMHRIVELSERDGVRLMRTKGDANQVIDPWTIDLSGSGFHRVRTTVPRVGVVLEFLHNTTRHTGGGLTWPGLLLLIGAIGYAVRLRHRDSSESPTEEEPVVEIARELRRTGQDIGSCAERLADLDLEPKQAQVLRTITEHATRVTALADRLTAPDPPAPAEAAVAEAEAAVAAREGRYTPRHGRAPR